MNRRRWMIGRLWRSFRARGPAYRIAASAVAAVLLLEVVGLAAWWIFGNGRLGRVVLTSDAAPLKVQVLGESGDEPIGEPVDVNPTATLSLPAGDYRLHVTGAGRLSRTYRMAVNRGEILSHSLTLDTGRLLGEEAGPANQPSTPTRTRPIPYAPTTTAVELTPGKADLVEWTPRSIMRRDGVTGEAHWDALKVPDLGGHRSEFHPWLVWLARRHESATLVQPAPDLDGDGTGDLVWTFPQETSFLALSGKNGSVLWSYVAKLDGPGVAYPAGPPSPGPVHPTVRPGRVIGQPAVADVDGDGRPDLIATMAFDEFPAEIERRLPGNTPEQIRGTPSQSRRVILAISGRSGTRLWSHAIDPAFTTITTQTGDRPAVLVSGGKTTTVGIVDGATWLGLDPATGRPRSGPIDLGFEPDRPLRYADLDGDGESDVIAVGPGTPVRKLSAFSMATGRPLWTATVDFSNSFPYGHPSQVAWALAVDLEGDGRSEIIVPDSGALDRFNGYHGVRVLDGSTGRPRWTRPMLPARNAEDWLVHVIAAPDLDRDGIRDILTTSSSRYPLVPGTGGSFESNRVYVDALSGKDGRPLWWWHAEVPANQYPYISPPRWWGRGPDDWPLLAVPIGGADPRFPGFGMSPPEPGASTVHMLEVSTGREVQTLTGFTRPNVADLDGDGLADLWGEYHGDLRAFRGEGPEAWRALGEFDPIRTTWGEFQPAADLDGDGIGDTLTMSLTAPGGTPGGLATGSRTALARSGRDGHLIWKSALDARRGWLDGDSGESYDMMSFPLPTGDLDGDGAPDVIVWEDAEQVPVQSPRSPATLPLQLLSGRTGRPLWVAGPLPLAFEAHGDSQIYWAIPQVVEPGARPDILVRHDSPFLAASTTPPPPYSPAQDHLARVSGRTGRILWDVPLVDRARPPQAGSSQPLGFGDLDGDGVPEVILQVLGVSASGQMGNELKVVSLRDGKSMWSRPFEARARNRHQFHILESDRGKPPDLVALFENFAGNNLTVVVRAFDGRDGEVLWTWDGGGQYVGRRARPWMATARLDGATKSRACVLFRESAGKLRLVILDARGREILRRDVPGTDSDYDRDHNGLPTVADLDGDGREEFLVWHSGRLHSWGGDGKELWSWPDETGRIERIVPPSAGRPAMLVLPSGLALDGKTGLPRWSAYRDSVWPPQSPILLDPGDPDRLPLMLLSLPRGTTVCRSAMRATSAGTLAPPLGTATPLGLARDDPRWTRPLPWTDPILRLLDLRGFLAVIGLALVNAVVPIGLLRLAARRRPWTIRLLMALPVAAALPLWVFQTFEPLIPAQIGLTPVSTRLVFVLGTLAGLPIVLYAVSIVANLFRRRWKALAWIAGLTVIGSAIIAAAWVWADSRTMPAIEHYGRSGWPLVMVPGAYAVGVLLPVGWLLTRPYRWITRPRRPEGGTP